MSVFYREDVGWWRSWLQQSYQAVKEKVSRAGALPPAGPRAASLQPGPSRSAGPVWAPGLRDEADLGPTGRQTPTQTSVSLAIVK